MWSNASDIVTALVANMTEEMNALGSLRSNFIDASLFYFTLVTLGKCQEFQANETLPQPSPPVCQLDFEQN